MYHENQTQFSQAHETKLKRYEQQKGKKNLHSEVTSVKVGCQPIHEVLAAH